ncbi:TIGR03752 family integrating conjugative element protein [Aquisalimonas sp. 2447]|uniref:TIGR03752 family integrating conjugative element protein n=1 Tax=Aquisalimonas sp. 2447 TaxID=2740807 RepID=UPI0014325A5F|nr:TIGR03752 family integrating conjugative element protein [Aquisalimonas sp. 2447]QIT57110.1 TIGR03752 family integrating conjugative element protein [Aquisalimonas sp. 2447]
MGGALMVSVKSNRLLPIIFGVVVLATLFVVLRSGGDDASGAGAEPMDEVPTVERPDTDTQADTIRTLAAEQRQLQGELEALREENRELRRERERAEREAVEAEEASEQQRGRLTEMLERIDRLSSRVEEIGDDGDDDPDDDGVVPGTDIPVGLGIGEDDTLPDPDRTAAVPDGAVAQETEFQWVEPVALDAGRSDGDAAEGGVLAQGRAVVEEAGEDEHSVADEVREARARALERAHVGKVAEFGDREAEPRYTVPRNSTLMGSTAMTALIGRIPRQGTVEDPAPFKVVVGENNLAASDIRIPGIEGMIFAGHAMGDWTLSCVRGEVESVTAVFEDGTVRTLPDPEGSEDETIGWISNDRGVPCIAGERISNAQAYLTQATTLAAAQAGAEAAAAAQTTTQVGQEGFTQQIVTGETGEFMAGRAASGAIEEVVQWLRARQDAHFDAVYAPAGERVAVHVDRELAIDYEIDGRRVSHEEFMRQDDGARRRLD